MNRSNKKRAHRAAERQATMAMLMGRPTVTNCNWHGLGYSEVQALFKQCCTGRANQKRPVLINQIMQSGRLRRKLRGGQWQLYVRPRRAQLEVISVSPRYTRSIRPIRDISFSLPG